IEKLNNNTKFPTLSPYYRDHKGSIIKKNSHVYVSKGIYVRENNKIFIKELPIFSWTEQYKNFLEDLVDNNQYISSMVNRSTESTIDFTIKFNNEEKLDEL